MDFEFENVVVTGAAGFIGFHLCQRLLNDGIRVTGIDNLNPYYDVRLKEARLENILPDPNFTLAKLDLTDRNGLVIARDQNRHSWLGFCHLSALSFLSALACIFDLRRSVKQGVAPVLGSICGVVM